MTFLVERGAREVSLTAAPEIQEITDRFGNVHRIPQLGIQQGGGSEIIRSDPLSAVWLGVKETAFSVERTFDSLGGALTGRE